MCAWSACPSAFLPSRMNWPICFEPRVALGAQHLDLRQDRPPPLVQRKRLVTGVVGGPELLHRGEHRLAVLTHKLYVQHASSPRLPT